MQAFHFDTVDSTNEEAKRLLRAGRITGPAYVLSREQTAGKGNRGRSWCSPVDAGLYLSVVEFAPSAEAPPTTLCTLATGVACVETLRDATGLDVRLKPVNDLYLDRRKLGGILVESLVERGSIRAVILGVGINTRRAVRAIPDASVPPVCLEEVMGAGAFLRVDFSDATAGLARAIRSWNEICWQNQTERVRAAWSRLAVPGARCPA